MDSGTGNCHLLPQELLEAQLGQIELLLAMYPTEGSVVMSDTASATLERLREAAAEDSLCNFTSQLREVNLLLELDIATDAENATSRVSQLSIAIPLRYDGEPRDDPPAARVRLQQPSWMNKAQVNNLMANLPNDNDLFSTIENISTAVSALMCQESQPALVSASDLVAEALTRVWFYFPSISTRSKRDDLVNHAPLYGLTGFLLAGKPGILCLEGGSQAIDDYMKFIKTESWGDIPAHHKKVSERFRQPGIESRAFTDMQEITGELERRGERANRNDMRALEAWLSERGLQEAFAKVLI